MERAKANDPVALCRTGEECEREGDYKRAFQYYIKAAALGNIEAHYDLSCMYHEGKGVEKDMKKAIYHAEEAAIGGHPVARYNLGSHDGRNGKIERAYKHFIIAANLGYADALDRLKKGFQMGLVTKEDYEAALRGHQAAVDATKSAQRDAAYAFALEHANLFAQQRGM
jgi:TPR repeat protein